MRTALTLALFLALTTACKKAKKPEGDTKGSATMQGSDTKGSAKPDTGSGSAKPDSGSAGSAAAAGSGSADAPQMAKGAGKCPSTVLHAETKAEVKGKDVVLTITSADKDAVAAIQKRAEELIKEKADAPGGTVHDQKGSQGGKVGLCPVYWEEGGKATQKKDPKGAIVTITPKDNPEALKTIIDERIKKSADWVKLNIKDGDAGNKGAVGGGKGEHGSTHAGSGDGKGKDRKGDGKGDGKGGGGGTGGGGGMGTGGGGGSGAKTKAPVKKPAPTDKGGGGW